MGGEVEWGMGFHSYFCKRFTVVLMFIKKFVCEVGFVLL